MTAAAAPAEASLPGVFVAADDLTGACDAAVAFAARGWRTSVALSVDALEDAADGVAVAVDTRTREAPPSGAVARAVAARLAGAAVPLIKIDSRLRGRYAEDLAAYADGTRPVVLSPALPAQGLPFSADDEVRRRLRAAGLECVRTADATTDRDLRVLVGALAGDRPIWAGSAGMAHALASHFGAERRSAAEVRAAPVLVVVGSRHATAQRQAAALAAMAVEAPAAAGTLARGLDAVVTTAAATEDDDGARVVRRLAAELAPAAARAGAVVLTGGATARACLDELGVRTLEIVCELEPGVVVSRGVDGRVYVTKAGWFGDDDTLSRVVAALRSGS